MPADQHARPLRTVERLVPRHAQKRRRKLSQRHRQNPCRLRAIENQRHLPLAAQRRNFLHRQNIAEHVRHVRADNRLRVLCDCRAEALDRIVPVKQPPSGNADIHADLIERSPTALCSKPEITTSSPADTRDRMARFSACVAFMVKTMSSGFASKSAASSCRQA